jgi:hypothetical protein
MKQILFLSVVLVSLGSCVNQRQKSNITGRTDEVYFTPSDTRIIVDAVSQYEMENQNNQVSNNGKQQSNAGNYTSSYSNRLRNFGSSGRYNYNSYQPMLVPTMMYNPYTGWSMGISYGYGFNSPFSPYYGCNMPYNDPFYSYGWNGWAGGYRPVYIYNPYMCSYNPYGFGYGGYGSGIYYSNYNPYANNYYNGSSGSNSANYGRRTGTTNYNGGTGRQYSNSQTTSPNSSSSQQNSNNNNTNGSDRYKGSGWWNGGSSSGSSGPSSGGGGNGRGTSGSSGGSTRRR